MRLVDAYTDEFAETVLYDLLAERPQENRISHAQMPSRDEHRTFLAGRPFYHWYLVTVPATLGADYVGAIECTDRNEIGVAIFKRYQRRGYGSAAIRLFMRLHQPLPAIAAIRNGHWLANIGAANISSKLFFAALGFTALQETWRAP